MKLSELYKRYIEDPEARALKREREVNNYNNQLDDRWSMALYWFIGLLVGPVLFFFGVIALDHILLIAIPWSVGMLLFYQNKPRYCRKCRKEMEKTQVSGSTYFVCDGCEQRVQIYLNNSN